MSDDIQKETERIHQGIVESLSFSEALANRGNEIKRLAIELESADRIANDRAKKNVELNAEIERLRASERSAWNAAVQRDEEIERLRGELDALQTHFDIKAKLGAEKDAEIERLRRQVTQRGARMQVMRKWMAFGLSGPTQNLWDDFKHDNPEAAEWFDQDGVPR